MTEYVATSLARRLIARMQATHERRRISVFAGPPGIGKTTAIDQFVKAASGSVAVVKVARRNAREVLVLQHALEALRPLSASIFSHAPSGLWELRTALFGSICACGNLEPGPARQGAYDPATLPRLTLVFDEAQNLSREAIEALRYWNDADRCYAPFPLGLVFVGNSEFSLAARGGDSVISAAVADRALYIQALDYEDVTDDDLSLFIDARCDCEPAALAALLRSFRAPRAQRSLRRLGDLIEDLALEGEGRAITSREVQDALLVVE